MRLADAAIDIYSTVAVLSRASYALSRDESAAQADVQIAQYFTRQASRRVQLSLAAAGRADAADLSQLRAIAEQAFDAGTHVHRHPIDA